MEHVILRAAAVIAALATVGGAAAWVIRIVRNFGNGIKCLLRKDMMDTYYHNREDAALHEYEKKNFLYEYEAYKALSGNSFIEDIAKQVREWKVTQ